MDCRVAKEFFSLARFGWPHCWHLLGRKKEARELFERLLDLRNDLGLLSEEYDPREKRQLGKFSAGFFARCAAGARESLAMRTMCRWQMSNRLGPVAAAFMRLLGITAEPQTSTKRPLLTPC